MGDNDNVAESETPPEPRRKPISRRKIIKLCTLVSLALLAGFIHYKYVAHLFENDRNFSYLSEMEREMSFQTEMGFYYSYYKTIVQERPFIAGITKLMYDRHVEYPTEVNAFNRFNIHPEVLIGGIYRYFEPILNTSTYRQCHIVDRGGGLSPVQSCVGLGQPTLFYLEAVWSLAGLTLAALFLHAAAISDSILGGILATASYFANHSECTRVQWAPNERENMAAPLLLLQLWLVSEQLTDKRGRRRFQLQMFIFILNCLCLLFWQFSQFIFLTQTAIFFVMEQIRVIDLKSLCILLHSHFCGLHLAVLLLQGNDMLKSSLYTSFFIVVSIYCLFFSSLRVKVESRLDFFVESWLVLLRIALVICTSLYLKKLISEFLEVDEDSHIWDILYSKFSDYKTFHSLLYTCSDVFDYLPWKSVKNLTYTMLIPLTLLSIFNVCNHWLMNAIQRCKKEMENKPPRKERDGKSDDEDSGIENTETVKNSDDIDNAKAENEDVFLCFFKSLTIEPAIFYNVSQMVVYGAMAGLVMRLKLLFVPQMCVVSALVMNKKYYRIPNTLKKYLPLFWLLCFIPVLYKLYVNVSLELSYIGEFSDVPKERLLSWVSSETSVTASFAGSLPLLAAVVLVTRRPVAAHPHYEHRQARERAYTMYKTYGRFTSEELYEELNKLRVTYLIVETKYCYGKSSKGCTFTDIWDTVEPHMRARNTLCHTLLNTRVDHFYPMYRDEHYAVFKLHDYSVRYMPRSFDT